MAFPQSFIDELISRNDITDVVGSYVNLTKRSGSSRFGLCPFHSEKTPSFSVNPEKQIYHCFGCGKGGGVINFVMEMENLSYPDAVRFLAKRAGLTVPEDGEPPEVRNRRARILALNKDAARFYHSLLNSPQGAAAVSYIQKRGISRDMVIKFGLGVAPDSWDSLMNAMLKKGYTQSEMLDAYLIMKSAKGGFYDTFRNRLMFPVIDVRGDVIGFSGRTLGDDDRKYVNSHDTAVFSKSRNLFALNLAKKSKAGNLILVEGNVDVVSLHQAGFDSAVASLGTSLTAEQARLMTRYTKNVVIAYDGDKAGTAAAQRAIGILEKTGISVNVLKLPPVLDDNGMPVLDKNGEPVKDDPDSFIKRRGADAFRALMEKCDNHIEYQLKNIRSAFDVETDAGRLDYLTAAADFLSKLDSAVEREVYGGRVAEIAGVSAQSVALEVTKAYKKRKSAEKRKEDRQAQRPLVNMQPADRAIRYDDPSSAAAEEGVVRLIMLDPSLIGETGGMTGADFSSPFLGKVFDSLRQRIDGGFSLSPSAISAELSASESSQLTAILQKPESASNGSRAMHDYTEKIRSRKFRLDAADLNAISERLRKSKGFGGTENGTE